MKYPDDEIFIYSFIFTGKSSVLVRVCLKCEWTSKHSQSHLKIKIVDNLIAEKKDAHRRLTQSIGKNVWLEQDFFFTGNCRDVGTNVWLCDCNIWQVLSWHFDQPMNHFVNANLTVSSVNHGRHVHTIRWLYCCFRSSYDVANRRKQFWIILDLCRSGCGTYVIYPRASRFRDNRIKKSAAAAAAFDCISRATLTLASFSRTFICDFHRNAIFHILIMLRGRTKKKNGTAKKNGMGWCLLGAPEVSCVKCQYSGQMISDRALLPHLISVTQHYHHCRRSWRT